MTQRSLPAEAVAEDAVRLTVGIAGGGNGAGVMGERLPVNPGADEETWLLAAVDGRGADDTGARVVSILRNTLSTDVGEDAGAAIRQAFRQANTQLYTGGEGKESASAVALYAHGKYATIASIGSGRAYLARAGRLNQITRDPTAIPAKGERADDKPVIPMLGARERLDSRQPGIYELTLLPEDRLLLCTARVFASTGDADMLSSLAGADAHASASALVPVGEMAVVVVAQVAAARQRQPVIVPGPARPGYLPLVALVLVVIVLALVLYLTGVVG